MFLTVQVRDTDGGDVLCSGIRRTPQSSVAPHRQGAISTAPLLGILEQQAQKSRTELTFPLSLHPDQHSAASRHPPKPSACAEDPRWHNIKRN